MSDWQDKLKAGWTAFNEFLNDVPKHYENAMKGWLGSTIRFIIFWIKEILTHIPELMYFTILGFVLLHIVGPIIALIEAWIESSITHTTETCFLFKIWYANIDNYIPAFHKCATAQAGWLKFGYLVSLIILLNITAGLAEGGIIKRFFLICVYGFTIYTWFDSSIYYDVEQFMVLIFIGIPLLIIVISKGQHGTSALTPNIPTVKSSETVERTKKIKVAIQRGNIVNVEVQDYKNGSPDISGGSFGKPGKLVNFTESTVTVQEGAFIRTYDAYGRTINTSSTKY